MFKIIKFPELKRFKSRLMLLILISGLSLMWLTNHVYSFIQTKKLLQHKAKEILEVSPIDVYKVQRMDIEEAMPLMGTVRGSREVELKFPTPGIIKEINFVEGQEVLKGQLIASLDEKGPLLKYRYNELEFEKYKKLFELGAITRARLEQAELEFASAKLELDKAMIYAPGDGVVATKEAEVGEFVTPNDRILTFIDRENVLVEVGVIEKDIPKLKLAQEARLLVDAYPEREFTGMIESISPIIEGRSRTMTVKIKVDNKDNLLLPGMFAKAGVTIFNQKDALVVPNSSLDKIGGKYRVYCLGGDGTVKSKEVKLGYVNSRFSVIEEGLVEGELIVKNPTTELKDGSKVQIAHTETLEVQEDESTKLSKN